MSEHHKCSGGFVIGIMLEPTVRHRLESANNGMKNIQPTSSNIRRPETQTSGDFLFDSPTSEAVYIGLTSSRGSKPRR